MKRTIGFLFSISAGLSLAGEGTPVEQVQSAVKKLSDASGYSWVTTVKSGDNSRFTPGPVEGQTEKGGCTRWVMSFGDHKSEALIKGCQVAVKSGDVWVKPEELRPPGPPPGPPGPPPGKEKDKDKEKDCPPNGEPGTRGEPVKGAPVKGEPVGKSEPERKGPKPPKEGRRNSFLANRLKEMKTPGEFAADLAGKVTALTADGDTFTGELSADAVKELLAFGGRREGHGHRPPEPANPNGSVRFTVKDGVLTALTLHLAATLSFGESEVAIDRTTQFDIKDIGSAKMDIPADAKTILDAASPAP